MVKVIIYKLTLPGLLKAPLKRMEIKQNVINQFRKPSGIMGRIVGWLMSMKNETRTDWTLEKLQLKPSDILLEIGYGPGVTIKKASDHLTSGFIAGIDHSEVMLEQASGRNRRDIENGKVKLECGTVWDLKFPPDHFDIIYGSNVHFFWDRPEREFRQLVSFLKPGGRLVMVFQPRLKNPEDRIEEIANKTKTQYEDAGLINVEIDFKEMRPLTCIYIGGQKSKIH